MASMSHRHFNFYRVICIIIIAIFVVGIFSPIPFEDVYALDAPLLTSPTNNSDTTTIYYPPLGIPTFVWSAVAGATEYRLQVDSEIGFNSPIALEVTTTNTQFTPTSMSSTLFADGEWYWRVRVEKPTPVSNWSAIWR